MKAVRGKTLVVSIVNQSACSGCHAKGACTVADYQEKEIEITDYRGTYKPGDLVQVLFKESKGFTALFWGYVMPFLLVFTTLIIGLAITENELKSGLLSLLILVPYYSLLYFFRNRLKKAFKFELEEIN